MSRRVDTDELTPQERDELLSLATLQEVIAYARDKLQIEVTESAVRRATADGRLASSRVGRFNRYSPRAVRAWLSSRPLPSEETA